MSYLATRDNGPRDPFHELAQGAVLIRLDMAATRRVKVMLRSQGWRDVAMWLRGLERDLDRCADTEAILALTKRVEGGTR
jgi:hypothetical protein